MLQKFGFTQYESQVFEVLTASASPLDATTIVKYSQVPKSKVYEVLNRLADKGLILSSFTVRKKLYTALPLDTIIEKLTDEFQTNVEELESKEYSLKPVDDRVWTIKNNEAIYSLSRQTLTKAAHSIYFSGWSDDLLPLLPLLEEKQDEGVNVEVMSIGETDSLLTQTHTLLPDERHEALERYQLLIIDEKELLFAGVEQGEWQGIQTLSSPLVKFFTEFFFHDVALAEITQKYEDTLMQDEKIRNILMKLRY
ncbi:TrmB family transcriptional regulator [Halobacillus sp. BBL2006]|uniref:TrmB family transcriptional regulator n=1 Tax=Halobacillus sp. BBL2006 TaxID=1543706 RepID=UPI000542644F|nr:helix-turn-helix domain-containing protein [Halobacillus sp. BBL2006]KHE73089.1 TrmB family transcriptional regulator [Halobacillus sp. BBL2006]